LVQRSTEIEARSSTSARLRSECDWSLTSFTAPEKQRHGLVPANFANDIHAQRTLAQLRSKDQPLEKYIFLSRLKSDDPDLFYKLCLENMPEITPIIYTPTVGDACIQFSQIYRRPEGLYISIKDKGNIKNGKPSL
jgi:malate dehydrogenase (oxaloacetate-decarboxylating)(NADP+)